MMPKRYRSQVSTPSDEMDFEPTLDVTPRQKRLKRVSSSPLPITHNYSSSETNASEMNGRHSSDGDVFASLSRSVDQLDSDHQQMKEKLAKQRASIVKLRNMTGSLLSSLQSSLSMMHMLLDKLRRERQKKQ